MAKHSLLKRILLTTVPPLLATITIQLYCSYSNLNGFTRMRDSAALFEKRVYRLSDLSNLKSYLYKISITYRNILLSKDQTMREGFVIERTNFISALKKEQETFEERATEEQIKVFTHINKTLTEFLKVSEKFDSIWKSEPDGILSDAVRLQGHAIILDELVPLRDAVGEDIAKIITGELSDTQAAKVSSDLLYEGTRSQAQLLGILVVILTLGSTVLLGWIVRGASRSLGEISETLVELGESVKGASTQVADASQSLAQESSIAAASIQETAATIHELNGNAKAGAEAASKSADLAESSLKAATLGRERVEELVTSVNLISESSGRIAEISKMIDTVAFQTNLLALNAAVEAARAGDAGKGFAVVAEEVRTLAQRCSASAKSISEVVQETVGRLNDGLSQAKAARHSLEEIMEVAGEVVGINKNVAGQIQAQQSQVMEISDAVTRLDTSTQANAAASEQTAASAQDLTLRSRTLDDLSQSLLQLVHGG